MTFVNLSLKYYEKEGWILVRKIQEIDSIGSNMGNIISNIQNRIIAVEYIPIPEMKNLTDCQVDIIKTTWEIPAAKVSLIIKRSVKNNWKVLS